MSRFDEETVVLYAAGRLDETRRGEIAAELARDPELSAMLDVIGEMTNLGRPAAYRQQPTWRRGVRSLLSAGWRHPVWLSLIVLVIVSGMAGGGWVLFMPHSLLHDDFNDDWYDSRLWLPPKKFGRDQGVKERDGRLKLLNRGYLVSKPEFDGPLDVSFDWSWSELGLNPVYSDILVVALYSSGEEVSDFPYEVQDGLVIRFIPWKGAIEVYSEPGHVNYHSTEDGAVKLIAEKWHHIRIVDDGDDVSIYVQSPGEHERQADEPVIRVPRPTTLRKGQLVFYNREHVADVPHESWIDNVIVRDAR